MNVGVFGQFVNDVLIRGFSLHIQRINIGIQIVFALVFHVEVNIEHLYTNALEVIIDESNGFDAVDKFNFDVFHGIDTNQALQQGKGDDDNGTACNGNDIIAHTNGQTKACHIPQ